MVIFSHTYLESDYINFKTFVFLAGYKYIWSLHNTDIKLKGQQFLNRSSTMLNNVFNNDIYLPIHSRPLEKITHNTN